MLEMKKVTGGYGRITILNGTSFNIPKASITTVIGPNGAGKSTVFKAIFGLLNIHSGEILLDGEDVTRKSPAEMIARGVTYILRARAVLLRDIGAAISPQNAFQLIQGVETLPLRLRQHNENAIKIADFLKNHPKVANVIFPKFQTGVAAERAAKYLKPGVFGALVGFELKGGREAGRRFIDALQLFYHLANIGDARSLAIHPSTTTDSQLSADDQLATGVTPGYVRLSIGIEHPDDIIADLAHAIDAA